MATLAKLAKLQKIYPNPDTLKTAIELVIKQTYSDPENITFEYWAQLSLAEHAKSNDHLSDVYQAASWVCHYLND